MNILSFSWAEPTSLAAELARPLKQVFVEFMPHGEPITLTLWRSNNTGLRIQSEMHDVVERREVGVLSFAYNSEPPTEGKPVCVASVFERQISVSKLVIEESGTSADSGVVLEAANDRIVIVAGVFPYTLAVSGLFVGPFVFQPEYPMEQYLRVPLG